MNRVCARWIPQILTEENKKTRVSASMEFLHHQRLEGDQFLDKKVTTDETMINLFDPEMKRESSIQKCDVYLLHGPKRDAASASCARGTDHECKLLFQGKILFLDLSYILYYSLQLYKFHIK